MFAGYREGYGGKCSPDCKFCLFCFQFSEELRTTPQVAAAGMVLAIAFASPAVSAISRSLPQLDRVVWSTHLLQILISWELWLTGQRFGFWLRARPISSIVISAMPTSTFLFSFQVARSTVRSSQHNIGVIGKISFFLKCFTVCRPTQKLGQRTLSTRMRERDGMYPTGSVPSLGVGRQGTRRGSLRYNVKVLQHLKVRKKSSRTTELSNISRRRLTPWQSCITSAAKDKVTHDEFYEREKELVECKTWD